MDSPAATRTPWSLAIAICLGLMVALVIGGSDLYFKTAILERGDIAVNALQIDNAKHGTEIYGNYSRFMFNHPGPAFFYAYAAGERVLHDWLRLVPTPHNAHLLASLFIQVSFFALAIAVVHCWIGSWTFVALSLLAGMWHFALARDAFTSIWPPHVLLMPFLGFVTALSSFAAGRTRDLAIAAVAGGFLFHGHVAQPLFVGGLGLLALFLHYRGRRAAGEWTGWQSWLRSNRALAIFCGGWAGLLLLPLAVDILRYGLNGNVSVIVHQFLTNTQEGKNILQSLLYFLSFAAYATNQEELFTTLGPQSFAFFREHFALLAGWLLFLAAPAAFAWRSGRKLPDDARRFFRAAYPIGAATLLLCVIWGMLQAGPMVQFNGYFYYGAYFFAVLVSIGVVCAIPGRLLPPPITAALCGVAGISASWLFRAPRLGANETGAPIHAGMEKVMKKNPSLRPKLLVFEHYAWPEAATVALELQRRGIFFYTSPAWNFMFGRQHDFNLLGPDPENSADVWWITRHGPDGTSITSDLQVFTQPAPLDPRNSEIAFALHANGFRFLTVGLSPGNVDFAWSDQRRTAFEFRPLPAMGNVRVSLDVQMNPGGKLTLQPAEVFFDGHSLGTVSAGGRGELPVTIPRELWNSAPTGVFELRFPEARRVTAYPLAASNLWHAWGLWKISFAVPKGD
jgi:hypothetical protein